MCVGYGLPDEVVIEKRNKGDTFVESVGVDVKISNLKFIQHDAIEGILCEFIIKNFSSASYSTVQKYSPPQTPPLQCVVFQSGASVDFTGI